MATNIELTVPTEITEDSNRVKPGKYYNLSAVVMNNDQESIIQDITWSLQGETAQDETTNITQDGYLYIGGNEPEGTSLTVQVQTADLNGDALSQTVTFTVRDWEISDLMSAPTGTITTVELDGQDFYLLAKNGNQGLIWAKNSVQNSLKILLPHQIRRYSCSVRRTCLEPLTVLRQNRTITLLTVNSW